MTTKPEPAPTGEPVAYTSESEMRGMLTLRDKEPEYGDYQVTLAPAADEVMYEPLYDSSVVTALRAEVARLNEAATESEKSNQQWDKWHDDMVAELKARLSSFERDARRYEKALNDIACYGDLAAWIRWKMNGSYAYFDEPHSVEIAHLALAAEHEKGKV